ncbi:MAG: PfkB family carbohydrate kinase [Faecalimonas sp.]|nr:PfkB family carbohydrate kinase [Faecalimonas sp.]
MFDVASLGEILIDFTPCGKSQAGQRIFEQNPGGAPANVLACLSKCGKKTAFIGKVGKDMHGAFLKETLEQNNISTEGLVEDEHVFTTLAFVALSDCGERSFSFARKPGADTCLEETELNREVIQNSRVFHIGSLSLTAEPSRSTTMTALEIAKDAGCIISYDPNYRAALWDSKEDAINGMRSVISYVDVMKISDEETALLTDIAEPQAAAEKLVAMGVPLVAVTLGADGALVCTKEGSRVIPGFQANMVDTTGAGDSFWGGFLNQLLELGKKPDEVSLAEAAEFARFGNAVASLCVEKRGAIPAMPSMESIRERM